MYSWNLSLVAPYHSHKISDIPAHVRPYNQHMISFLKFDLIINIVLDIICWGDLLSLLMGLVVTDNYRSNFREILPDG